MNRKLLLALLLAPLCSVGQITINSNQLPYPGLAYIMVSDTLINTPVPAGGMNQSWDFSSLNNDGQDTTSYISAAGTPFFSDFPASNLASHSPQDSAFVYMTTNASGFYIDGTRFYGDTAGLPLPINKFVFNPAYLIIPTPFTYGNTRNSSYRFQLDFSFQGTPARLISNTQQVFECDGYGALQLPNATYPNTLRVKTTQTSFDSLLLDPTGFGFYVLVNSSASQNTLFQWLRTAQPSLLMTLSADSLGAIAESADFFEGTAVTGLSTVEPNLAPPVRVYPNPASDYLIISLPDAGNSSDHFQLFDINGRIISEKPLEGLNQYGFEVASLSEGIYTWNIPSRNASGRLVIRH